MTPAAYRLIPSDDYERSRATLTSSALRALQVIEEGIAHNPFSYPGVDLPGHERHDYGGLIVVRSGGVMVSYVIRSLTVVLLEVMDEFSPPPWYRAE
jgi:hypothetical protein